MPSTWVKTFPAPHFAAAQKFLIRSLRRHVCAPVDASYQMTIMIDCHVPYCFIGGNLNVPFFHLWFAL